MGQTGAGKSTVSNLCWTRDEAGVKTPEVRQQPLAKLRRYRERQPRVLYSEVGPLRHANPEALGDSIQNRRDPSSDFT
jgi:hypothetical protein